jgi:hypothetical protein
MACVWGLLGASAIEAHHLHSAIGRVKNLPWKVQGELPLKPYLLALGLRLALGVGLAAGSGASGQAGGPVGVMAVGIAAPKVVEQLASGRLAESERTRAGQYLLSPAPLEPQTEPPPDSPTDTTDASADDAQSVSSVQNPARVSDSEHGQGAASAGGTATDG